MSGYDRFILSPAQYALVLYAALIETGRMAEAGMEATKAMKPKFGKAAVHEAAAEGVADQGALACFYLADAMYRYISGK